jgi:hypothetical protein
MTVGSGTNRALLVKLGGYTASGGISPVASVTWGAQTLSLIAGYTYSPPQLAGSSYRVELWGLVNPASGNQPVTVNYGGAWTYWSIDAIAFSGVDQTGGTTTFYNSASRGGIASPSGIGLTSAAGDAATDVIAAPGQTLSNPSQTLEFDVASIGAGSYALGVSSPSFSWSISAPGYWASALTCIKADDGGGAGAIQPPVSLPIAPLVRSRLTADGTIYVNESTGNDTSNGTTPFRTVQAAYDWAQANLDLASHKLTIQVQGALTLPAVLSGPIVGQRGAADVLILGSVASPIAWGTSSAILINVAEGARFAVQGLSLSAGNFCLSVSQGTVYALDCTYTGASVSALDAAGPGSIIGANNSTFNGTFGAGWTGENNCMIVMSGSLAFSATFTNAAEQADLGGMLDTSPVTSITGTINGASAHAYSGGIIQTGGHIPPGSGSTASGGIIQ